MQRRPVVHPKLADVPLLGLPALGALVVLGAVGVGFAFGGVLGGRYGLDLWCVVGAAMVAMVEEAMDVVALSWPSWWRRWWSGW